MLYQGYLLWWGCLTSLQRWCQHILQPQTRCVRRSIFTRSATGLNTEFPSSGLVVLLVCPTISRYLVGEEKDSYFFFQGHEHEAKHKQLRPGFELGLPILFLTMITVALTVPQDILITTSLTQSFYKYFVMRMPYLFVQVQDTPEEGQKKKEIKIGWDQWVGVWKIIFAHWEELVLFDWLMSEVNVAVLNVFC